jgi:hypothetical protein
MLSWHHSGFHVYVGTTIWPDDQSGLENLAEYIVRTWFSQQRMDYITVEKSAGGVAKVIYTSRDGKSRLEQPLNLLISCLTESWFISIKCPGWSVWVLTSRQLRLFHEFIIV